MEGEKREDTGKGEVMAAGVGDDAYHLPPQLPGFEAPAPSSYGRLFATHFENFRSCLLE